MDRSTYSRHRGKKDPWGFAVNEAMCARSVQDGVNGYMPAAGGVAGFAHALERLIEDEGLRPQHGQASPARILPCLEGVRSALAGLEFRSPGTNCLLRRTGSYLS